MNNTMKDEIIEKENTFEVHRCVVCNGFGTLKFGTIKCHACNGKGYIIVDKLTGLPVEDRQNGKHKLD